MRVRIFNLRNTYAQLILILSGFIGSEAFACSCGGGGDHQARITSSDVSFDGLVTGHWFDELPYGRVHYTFDAIDVFKAPDGIKQFHVSVKPDNWIRRFYSCGIQISTNIVYRVYAYEYEGVLSANICSVRAMVEPMLIFKTSQNTLPRDLSNTEVKTIKDKVIGAGCAYSYRSDIEGGCGVEGKNGSVICGGHISTGIYDITDFHGELEYEFRFNTKTEALSFLKSPGFWIDARSYCG